MVERVAWWSVMVCGCGACGVVVDVQGCVGGGGVGGGRVCTVGCPVTPPCPALRPLHSSLPPPPAHTSCSRLRAPCPRPLPTRDFPPPPFLPPFSVGTAGCACLCVAPRDAEGHAGRGAMRPLLLAGASQRTARTSHPGCVFLLVGAVCKNYCAGRCLDVGASPPTVALCLFC